MVLLKTMLRSRIYRQHLQMTILIKKLDLFLNIDCQVIFIYFEWSSLTSQLKTALVCDSGILARLFLANSFMIQFCQIFPWMLTLWEHKFIEGHIMSPCSFCRKVSVILCFFLLYGDPIKVCDCRLLSCTI